MYYDRKKINALVFIILICRVKNIYKTINKNIIHFIKKYTCYIFHLFNNTQRNDAKRKYGFLQTEIKIKL